MSNREAAAAITAEREAFEQWCVTEGWVERPSARANGTYINGALQARWLAWQARARLSAPVAATWEPSFEAHSVNQERLVREFCFEIAGPRGATGSPPDPVRLLEMAQALYEAERKDLGPAPVAAQPADSAMTDALLAVVRAAREAMGVLERMDVIRHIAPDWPEADSLRRALAAFDALEKP